MRDRPITDLIREGRLVITPALAQRILKECAYPGQRRAYNHHVILLSESMAAGRWRGATQVFFGMVGEQLYLMDGQHRMHGVVKSGKDIEFQISIEPVATMEDLAPLYWTFNVMTRARTVTEILNAARISTTYQLDKGIARAIYDAAGLIATDFRRTSTFVTAPTLLRNIDKRMALASDWWGLGRQYQEAISVADSETKRRLLMVGTTAVALITFKYQPEKAAEFWRTVAADDGLRRGDPRKSLLKDLHSRRTHSGGQSAAVDHAVAAAAGWSAWLEGNGLAFIKVFADAFPIIAGTPYTRYWASTMLRTLRQERSLAVTQGRSNRAARHAAKKQKAEPVLEQRPATGLRAPSRA